MSHPPRHESAADRDAAAVSRDASTRRAPLSALTHVLAAKIVLTLAAWCVPLLLLPPRMLEALGFPLPQPLLFLRLLGMAYVALVVGYGFGLRACRRGDYPGGTVWVGIVSNGGACVLLALAAASGTWSGWGPIARAAMWASLGGTAAIAALLTWFGPLARRGAGARAGTIAR